MWQDNRLHLPNSIWETYRRVLIKHGRLEECQANALGRGEIGGEDAESALRHFVYRFPNSASRMCYIVENPKKDCNFISDEIKDSLFEGTLCILDLVGGTGAAVVSLLCCIDEMRRQRIRPMLPLNISIFAADISSHALSIYEEMLGEITGLLLESGIAISWKTEVWDARDVSATAALCDRYLQHTKGSELFVIVSTLSGIKNRGLDNVSRSFLHVTERISNHPSTFIWIEPVGKSGLEFISRVANLILDLGYWFTNKTPQTFQAVFSWWHKLQLTNQNLPGGVLVRMYKRNRA